MRCVPLNLSLDPYSDLRGDRHYHHWTDEKTGSGRESTSLGSHRENVLNPASSGSKVPQLWLQLPSSGILTPDQERHTYLIQSPLTTSPTLWDHHRQLGFIVGACGNILGEKAQWWFLHSDTLNTHLHWMPASPCAKDWQLTGWIWQEYNTDQRENV